MSSSPDSSQGSTIEMNWSRTPANLEKELGSAGASTLNGNIDAEQAKQEFNRLNVILSRVSPIRNQQHDIEAGITEQDLFDLRRYLNDTHDRGLESGLRTKKLGVVWEGLTVVGAGGKKIYVRTFVDAIKEFCLAPVLPFFKDIKAKTIIQDLDGVAKPGQLVLVLGRPGSGCSTFLKSIANRREEYLSVEGEVTYGGISAELMRKRYAGEVVYNQEDDVHNPMLTVGQTLDFALSAKTPGNLLPGETKTTFRKQVSDLLLRMVNIEHTRDTNVGDHAIRGVSGGERKRVSIVEMMTTRAGVCAWDNSTRGLDASTALDYAKSLRVLTDIFDSTNFVSLYQAGEGIYQQFDLVLLIDEGRQIYYGPAKEARQYMIDLGYKDKPRMPTSDFLTGCLDPYEREFQDGLDETMVPSTPQSLAAVFKKSLAYRRIMAEVHSEKTALNQDNLREKTFKSAVINEKRRYTSKKSPFTISFVQQVFAVTKRQFQIKMQDKLDRMVSINQMLTAGFVAGSAFYDLPRNSSGGFTRGGLLFLLVIVPTFMALNELNSTMDGRVILHKQISYRFYRPAAHTLGASIASIPFGFVQMLVYAIPIYFLSGLVTSASAFFTNWLVINLCYFVMLSLARFIGTLCTSFEIATRTSFLMIAIQILYSGYMIPVFAMKRWLFWLYYLNPVAYAFQAVMGNEFGRIDFTCDGSYIVPRNLGGGTTYSNGLGPNQVCTFRGATPGSSVISGESYISAAFSYSYSNVYRNIGIMFAFWAGFTLLDMAANEYFSHGSGSSGVTVFARPNEERKKLNAALEDRRKARQRKQRDPSSEETLAEDESASLVKSLMQPFTFEDLTYTVDVPGGKRQLLDHVYGYVKPGTLTALVGSSGAGKTTLLDVLANRKSTGVISGDLLVNGQPIDRSFQRSCGYAEQQDVHEGTATVREAFRFSAYLRQPASVSKEEKDAYVEECIALLELEDLADAMIGEPGFGLDVEARKRVTIGVELAARVELLLFLDEPTSGLDGQSAYNIVRFLRKLAAAGQSILCTIHQPNAVLFENFDRLLLLGRGGQTIYHGEIGKDSKVLIDYLARNGAECPADANPAEFVLDAIGAGSQPRIGNRDWADIWLDSPEFEAVKKEIKSINEEAKNKPMADSVALPTSYSLTFAQQLRLVVQRTNRSFWRNADYGLTRVLNHISIALLTSLTYLSLGNSSLDVQSRLFAIFFVTILPMILISAIEPVYITSRGIFNREFSSMMYSPTVFSMSQLIAEAPYALLCALVFYLCFYFPIGLSTEATRAGYQFIMIVITEFYAITLGQMIASCVPNTSIAGYANPFFLLMLVTFCGVTVPRDNMPTFWRSWMYQLDPFTRLISGMLSTELYQLPVQCLPNELYTFTAPAGQTCATYAEQFISAAGGYLIDGAATTCQYCQLSSGDGFLATFGLQDGWNNRWRDLGIYACFLVFNAGVTIIASNLLRWSKR